MENSDQDVANPPSGTLKVESGGINPALRNDGLEDALIRTGLKRSEVGRLLGVASSTVYRWGRHTATPKLVLAFLRFYESWNQEDELLAQAKVLIEGQGTRYQLLVVINKMAALHRKPEEFLQEIK